MPFSLCLDGLPANEIKSQQMTFFGKSFFNWICFGRRRIGPFPRTNSLQDVNILSADYINLNKI